MKRKVVSVLLVAAMTMGVLAVVVAAVARVVALQRLQSTMKKRERSSTSMYGMRNSRAV